MHQEPAEKNRTGKWPVQYQSESKKLQRGYTDFRTTEDIIVIKWTDNNDVILVSNFENAMMMSADQWLN